MTAPREIPVGAEAALEAEGDLAAIERQDQAEQDFIDDSLDGAR